jgi:hypothetical protein
VAQEVVGQVSAAVGAAVSRRDVWLLQAPPVAAAQAPPALWRVVGMAAVDAMEYGRACLWRARSEAGAGWPAAGPLRDSVVTGAARRAVTRFWGSLAEVAAGCDAAAVAAGAATPFLAVGPAGGLVVRVPGAGVF